TAQTAFATEGWGLDIDPESGAITALVNHGSGVSLFTGPAHHAVVIDDPTDTWSHGVDRFALDGAIMRGAGIALLERGPIRTVVEISACHGDSLLTTTILLPEDAALPVELRVTLDWRERHRLLRLAYPLGAACFEYEVPAGWTRRPDDGREVPGQRWVR